MSYEVFPAVIMVPIAELHELPISKELHSDFDPAGRDAWLVDDIRKHGVLLPLMIDGAKTIKDGHRRFWAAKFLGIAEVPCNVLRDDSSETAFASAQLGRPLKLYAKCNLYRGLITDLMRRGQARAIANLQAGNEPGLQIDEDQLQTDWTRCEEVLGVSRRSLIRGVKLLESIEELAKSADFEIRGRAVRLANTFRNRGLKPALRMAGESDCDVERDETSEPDCGDWREQIDDEPTPKLMCAKKDPVDRGWSGEVQQCLNRARNLLKKHGRLTTEIDRGLALARQAAVGELVAAA